MRHVCFYFIDEGSVKCYVCATGACQEEISAETPTIDCEGTCFVSSITHCYMLVV